MVLSSKGFLICLLVLILSVRSALVYSAVELQLSSDDFYSPALDDPAWLGVRIQLYVGYLKSIRNDPEQIAHVEKHLPSLDPVDLARYVQILATVRDVSVGSMNEQLRSLHCGANPDELTEEAFKSLVETTERIQRNTTINTFNSVLGEFGIAVYNETVAYMNLITANMQVMKTSEYENLKRLGYDKYTYLRDSCELKS